MADSCFGSILVCALRVARLSTAGAPDDGVTNGYISNALVKADLGLELEPGLDVSAKNGCDALLYALKKPDKIKRATISMDALTIDFALYQLLVGGDLFTFANGDPMGWQVPDTDDDDVDPVSVELWSQAMDGNEQATPAGQSNAAAWFHWVLPKVQFSISSIPLSGTDITAVNLTGNGSSNSNITANGPFNDWPARIAANGGITKPLGVFLDDDLPTADCSYEAVPSGS